MAIANPSGQPDALFGISVAALENKRIIVGAPRTDVGGFDRAGAVYLLDRDTGAPLLTIPNPFPFTADFFGRWVAPLEQNKIVVGAPGDDVGGIVDAGTIYVFDASTGALLLAVENPDPAPNDQFGSSVAPFKKDILVGAQLDDAGATNAGSAYLVDSDTGAVLLTIPNPAPAPNDQFTFWGPIALGEKIVVPAMTDSDPDGPGGPIPFFFQQGAVFTYDQTGALLLTIPNPHPESAPDHMSALAALGDDISSASCSTVTPMGPAAPSRRSSGMGRPWSSTAIRARTS